MPIFKYRSATVSGKQETGLLTSENKRLAKNELKSRGLTILVIEEIDRQEKQTSKFRNSLFSPGLYFNELVLITRQLASLLDASLPLEQALSALIEQTDRKYTKKTLESIRSDISSGLSLSQALANHKKDFSETYRGLVSSGENIGKLSGVLDKLANYLERRQSLVSKVRLAFTYPAIVSIIALLVVVFLLTYVVPKVVSVFAQTQQELPGLTKLMLQFSELSRQWGVLFLSLCACLFIIFRYLLRFPAFKFKWHALLLNTPGLGKFEKSLNSARFTSTLAISADAGVPVLDALNSSKKTISNSVMKSEISEISESVREGTSLSRALTDYKNFSPLLSHMIKSGEFTGTLPEMLNRAAKTQEDDLERRTLFLASMLEPALILIMGGFVLLIVLAVLMPIIEINSLIQ